MVPRITVEQAANHPLVLRTVFFSFTLEKLDAAFRERDSHLHAFLANCQLFGRRQKVRNNPKFSQGFVGVLDFRGHRSVCLFANNRHQ